MTRPVFLAGLHISNGEVITRAYDLDGTGLSLRNAKQAATWLVRSIYVPHLVSAEVMLGWSSEGSITLNSVQPKDRARVNAHENFHSAVSRKGLTYVNYVEESMAKALEYPHVPQELARDSWTLSAMAVRAQGVINACMGLEATTTLLTPTMKEFLRIQEKNTSEFMLSPFNLTAFIADMMYRLLYRECVTLVKERGPREAKKIFYEAIALAQKASLMQVKEFLLRQTNIRQRRELEEEVRTEYTAHQPIVRIAPTHMPNYAHDTVLLRKTGGMQKTACEIREAMAKYRIMQERNAAKAAGIRFAPVRALRAR